MGWGETAAKATSWDESVARALRRSNRIIHIGRVIRRSLSRPKCTFPWLTYDLQWKFKDDGYHALLEIVSSDADCHFWHRSRFRNLLCRQFAAQRNVRSLICRLLRQVAVRYLGFSPIRFKRNTLRNRKRIFENSAYVWELQLKSSVRNCPKQ